MRKNLVVCLVCTSVGLVLGAVIGAVWHRQGVFPFPQLSQWRSDIVRARSAKSKIPGHWHKVRGGGGGQELTDEQRRMIEQLTSVGYLAGSQPAPQRKSITVYDRERAYEGVNLVVSGHAPEAILMDMEGRELHKWSSDASRVWPDFIPKKNKRHTFWRRAHLMDNGDLYAIFDGIGLIKLDKDSNPIWGVRNGAHHDLHVARDGRIYVLTRKAHIKETYNAKAPILEDFINVLDQDGNELEKISILDVIKNSHYAPLLTRLKRSGDILHSNTIELIEDDTSGAPAAFKKGRVLISVRQLDLVCVVDLEMKSVVWAETDFWRRQHQPTMLENGNMLVLDNKGFTRRSSVIEFDPAAREVRWRFGGVKEVSFYTPMSGSCQRLANGNTLIVESDPGRAFEVTPDKTIVWEFVSPHRAGEDNELIATLFDVVRFERDFAASWLE